MDVPAWWVARLGMSQARTWVADRHGPFAALSRDALEITGRPRERLVLELLRRIDAGEGMHPVGNAGHWEQVWARVAEDFERTGDVASLRPPFIRSFQPVRFNGEFRWMEDPDWEWHWWECLRRFVFEEWLADCPTVVEYGCGSGHNLAAFAQVDPSKEYFGLDFSESAARLVIRVGREKGWRLRGLVADVRSALNWQLPVGAGVLTVGALEQTGDDWTAFMEDLIRQRPAIVVHVEPIVEWLDPTNLVDYAAIRHMGARGYWSGFPAWMEEREREARVEVVHRYRTGVGSLWIEGYNLFVWKPGKEVPGGKT